MSLEKERKELKALRDKGVLTEDEVTARTALRQLDKLRGEGVLSASEVATKRGLIIAEFTAKRKKLGLLWKPWSPAPPSTA